MLNKDEIKRFERQIRLPEIGMKGQEKLRHAKVLIIGAGGLGCPALQYLAAAGIGSLGIVDFDKVEESNLHRQILYGIMDLGKDKATLAAERLQDQYSLTKITGHPLKLTCENAEDIINKYDIIVDGSDNFTTRYLVNDTCVLCNKTLVFGSIYKFQAQVSVFNHKDGPTYRCLYPDPPTPGSVPNCEEAGVLGILPGIIGCYMANETIKLITGIGKSLSGNLFVLDILTMQHQLIKIPMIKANKEIQGLISCKNPSEKCDAIQNGLKEITATELKGKLDRKENIQIIDVREPFEYSICNLGGELMPLEHLLDEPINIARDKEVIVHCHHGARSKKAISKLMEKEGYTNLFNLKGGIHAWAKEVDISMETY